MHKLYILLLAAVFLNISVSSASNTIDSIGVENNKGKKVIIYKVEAKETYYSISKKFNVSYKDVMEFNDNQFLQIGVILKVPTNLPFSSTNTVTASTPTTGTFEYTIKAKDNLNMLAEKYGTTVNEIKKANNLSSINLQIGQVLKIPGNGTVSEEASEETKTPATPVYKKPVVTENVMATEHSVKAKENLNLIAKNYNTTVDEIKNLNGLTSNNLQIGQILKIPSANANSVETTPTVKINEEVAIKTKEKPVVEKPVVEKTTTKIVTPTPNNDGSIEHLVATNETIYSIAKKYNTTTYQIKTTNNLASNDLTVGQKLIIKNAKPTTEAEPEETTGDSNTMKDPSLKLPANRYGLSQIEEKGAGVWIADQDLDPSKMLILHRTAPIGTVMKITNPMTSRSTFAKVVGKFTENESTKDVIIVMTKAVADAIGALDKRFFCNISYGALENEQ